MRSRNNKEQVYARNIDQMITLPSGVVLIDIEGFNPGDKMEEDLIGR